MDISSMLEVQVNEVKQTDIKENVTPGSLLPRGLVESQDISNEEKNFYKQLFSTGIAAVRFGRLHCTGCDVHIGSAPSEAKNMYQHPVLKTLLCAECREFYGDGTFEQGDDATDMFCRWCANGGNLYCCSYCSNTFCSKCIKRNLGPAMRKKIEADEKWKCFVCDPSVLYSMRAACWALLEHIPTVTRIIRSDTRCTEEDREYRMDLDESRCCPRRRKRKRRRTSNSEEEDETYSPTAEEVCMPPKRKVPRRSYTLTKGTLQNGTSNSSIDRSTIKVSHARILPKPQNTIAKLIPILPKEEIPIDRERHNSKEQMPSSSASKNTVKIARRGAGAHSLNIAPILSAVPTAKLLKRTSANPPVSSSQFTLPTFQCVPSQGAPMVSIPTQQNVVQRIVITNSVRIAPKITPNIIDIDSDPEETSTPHTSDTSAPQMATAAGSSESFPKPGMPNSPAVPVALVSARSTVGNETRPDQPLRERRSTIPRYGQTFSQILQPFERELESTFTVLKNRFREILENIKRDENKGLDVDATKVTIRRFHRLIRGAVMDLAGINDRVVRGYNKWKRFNTKRLSKDNPLQIAPIVSKERNLDIPLELTCDNESDNEFEKEADDSDPLEHNVINPSELVTVTNALEDLILYKKRKCFDRGVGQDEPILKETRSTQVDDAELKDYEGSIFYSVVKKSESSPELSSESEKRNSSTTRGSKMKYEQEFLDFLGQRTQDKSADLYEECEPLELLVVDLIEDTPSSPDTENSTTRADEASKSEKCNNVIPDKTVNNTQNTKATHRESYTALRNALAETIVTNNDSISETDSLKKEMTGDSNLFNNTSEKISPTAEIPLATNSSIVESNTDTIASNAADKDESEDDCTIIDE